MWWKEMQAYMVGLAMRYVPYIGLQKTWLRHTTTSPHAYTTHSTPLLSCFLASTKDLIAHLMLSLAGAEATVESLEKQHRYASLCAVVGLASGFEGVHENILAPIPCPHIMMLPSVTLPKSSGSWPLSSTTL